METWKDIEGWEGWYQVSDAGRVRSLTRVSIAGGAPATYQGRVLAAGVSKNGYPLVALTRPGVRYCRTVHTLVMRAFVGAPPKGREVCHGNGVRTDCRLKNLRYDTRRNNALDRNKHGTMLRAEYPRGEKIHNAVVNTDAVLFILAHPEMTLKALGEMFGVHLGTVHSIRKRKTWAHVISPCNLTTAK